MYLKRKWKNEIVLQANEVVLIDSMEGGDMELRKCECGFDMVIADVYCNITQKNKGCAVLCSDCGNRGDTFKTNAEAIRAWNEGEAG